MSDLQGFMLTALGAEILRQAHGDTDFKIKLVNIVIGNGIRSESDETPDGLISAKASTPITSIDQSGTVATVRGVLDNSTLTEGFALTEVAVTAIHPTQGEVAYVMDYVLDITKASYVPAGQGAPIELNFEFPVTVTSKSIAEIIVTDRFYSLSRSEFDEHESDPGAHDALLSRLAAPQPVMTSPVDGATGIGATPVLRCASHKSLLNGVEHYATAWTVKDAIGLLRHSSGPLSTALTEYELPAGVIQEGGAYYRASCVHYVSGGLISVEADWVGFWTKLVFNYIRRPTILTPASGSTGVGSQPACSMSDFMVVGGTDDHIADQYQIKNASGVVLYTSAELDPRQEFIPPAGLLATGQMYTIEGRQQGSAYGWSEWTVGAIIYTADAFIAGDNAISFPSWAGYDNASSVGMAQANNAALRSSGVDQDTDDPDWISFQLLAKIRDPYEFGIVSASTTQLVLSSAESGLLAAGSKIFCGDTELTEITAATVTESVADPADVVDVFGDESCRSYYPFDGSLDDYGPNGADIEPNSTDTYVEGNFGSQSLLTGGSDAARMEIPFDTSAATVSVWSRFSGDYSVAPLAMILTTDHGYIGLGHGQTGSQWYLWATAGLDGYRDEDRIQWWDGEWHHYLWSYDAGNFDFYVDGELILTGEYTPWAGIIKSIGDAAAGAVMSYDQLRIFDRALTGVEVNQLYAESMTRYTCSDFTPSLITAPTRVLQAAQLTAATGAAGTAFSSGDFSAVAAESIAFGTDGDPVRPDYLLLQSAQQTPAETFRRIALGVSGLHAGAESRVSEVQADVWKSGS